MFRRFARWLGVALVILLGAATGGGAQTSPPLLQAAALCTVDPTITPGEGVSRLRLGMTLTEVAQFLAAPPVPAMRASSGGSAWEQSYYYPASALVIVAQDNRIVYIMLGASPEDGRKCATREGIRVGGSTTTVKAGYGDPESTWQEPNGNYAKWVYNKRGLVLGVTIEGRVLSVSVFAPGNYCTLQENLFALRWQGPACSKFTPPLS